MDRAILGLHHMTAIVDEPQRNVDFYAEVLGLRLVKQTVNFDDPQTYHLYFGDEAGRPGTLVTFFPWTNARRGRRGSGQVSATTLAVPEGALEFWAERLRAAGVVVTLPQQRLGEQVLSFTDPAGLQIELVAQASAAARPAWTNGPIPTDYAIRGIAAVTMVVAHAAPTVTFLRDVFGFEETAVEGGRTRLTSNGGSVVDVVEIADVPWGQFGVGTVHHIAWRVADDEEQRWWRDELAKRGAHVTQILDRQYFHSIYFREPGGVIFEIATDEPGFATDEPLETLGTELRLPPWLEAQRPSIERVLPKLRLPESQPVR